MLSTQLIYEYKNSNSIIDIHPYAEILHGNNTRNPHGTIIMQMQMQISWRIYRAEQTSQKVESYIHYASSVCKYPGLARTIT